MAMTRKSVAKKSAAKKAPAKKTATKKASARSTAKSATPRKGAVKKATVKKSAPKKAVAKKPSLKKAAPKQPALKKVAAKKKVVAKKTAAKKPVARKVAATKPVAKRATGKKPVSKVASKAVGQKTPKKVTPKAAAGGKGEKKPAITSRSTKQVGEAALVSKIAPRKRATVEAPIKHISPQEAVAHIQALLEAKQERVRQGPSWPGAAAAQQTPNHPDEINEASSITGTGLSSEAAYGHALAHGRGEQGKRKG